MKKLMVLSLAVIVTVSLFSAFSAGDDYDTYEIDTAKSSVYWKAEKVTGFHEGFISLNHGKLFVDGETLRGGNFEADMNSFTITDLSGGKAKKLEKDLKSDKFFETTKYPTSSLKIKKLADKGDGNWTVYAEITIKGLTSEIKFPAKMSKNGEQVTASADEVLVDRTKHNMTYKSSSFFEKLGDKAIYDNFKLKVNLVGMKK